MELKHYLRILALRWRIIMIPVVLVLVVSLYQYFAQPTAYATEVRASIIRELDAPPADAYAYDGYYNYLASEFAIDDLVEAVRGNVFASAVAERATAAGYPITEGEVRAVMAVSRKHRIVSVAVSSSESARTAAVAAAAEAELEEQAFQYISVSSEDPNAIVRIIQRPEPPARQLSREQLLIVLELFAALGLGVLLAFVVHYLDDRLYDADTVAYTLNAPILASVPAERP